MILKYLLDGTIEKVCDAHRCVDTTLAGADDFTDGVAMRVRASRQCFHADVGIGEKLLNAVGDQVFLPPRKKLQLNDVQRRVVRTHTR